MNDGAQGNAVETFPINNKGGSEIELYIHQTGYEQMLNYTKQ